MRLPVIFDAHVKIAVYLFCFLECDNCFVVFNAHKLEFEIPEVCYFVLQHSLLYLYVIDSVFAKISQV